MYGRWRGGNSLRSSYVKSRAWYSVSAGCTGEIVMGGNVTKCLRQGLWNHPSQLLGLGPWALASMQLHFLMLKQGSR